MNETDRMLFADWDARFQEKHGVTVPVQRPKQQRRVYEYDEHGNLKRTYEEFS